ncbi:serine/threonine protein kinase [Micromonospora echinospora]|uniref:non-specific serine/threonine protein kinase n=1 Tax=Micromonospora echinospora TaxID=1877 RepID=A0A1C4W6X2_MICEC|nr:serine/threonine-protein kinase [Micromonospora echinospora]OZV80026.1 serine/threonine protein kinase [Micromonospora echinospora]SCE91987.1 serine/threonine protein kinase [Micromonospora echinospora]
MLSPGVQLGNRYRLDERIASGGMGDVWRGTDQVLGRVVAVKSLLPALLDEPGFAERFRGEARTMATINHPGVVDIYDFGSDQQIAFLIMEYVEGDALSATLNRVGRLTPARTMALVAQAADALHAAHGKGIVHRDVKPGNLLVRPNGTLVLTDFGIARSELVGQLTAAGSVLGTASYISPEQAAGAVATPASDVYALGVVAYQCLAGRRPFEGDNPLEIAMRHVRETPRPLPGDIPPPVRALVDRAMAKDPAARWPSAAALAGAARQVKAALAHQNRPGGRARPVSVAPSSPAMPPATPPARAQVPPPQRQHPRPPVAPPPQARPPAAARPAASVPVSPPRPAPPVVHRPVAPPPATPSRPSMAPPGYPRGAAPVPSAPPRPVGYAYQSGPPAPDSGPRARTVLVVIALAVLVLICSGVISYRLQADDSTASSAGLLRSPSVMSEVPTASGDDDGAPSSYRRMGLPVPGGDGTTTSEGRQTR